MDSAGYDGSFDDSFYGGVGAAAEDDVFGAAGVPRGVFVEDSLTMATAAAVEEPASVLLSPAAPNASMFGSALAADDGEDGNGAVPELWTTPQQPGTEAAEAAATAAAEEEDVARDALWEVSSAKAGFGVDCLCDGKQDTYWQSDGDGPHWVCVHFRSRTLVTVCPSLFCSSCFPRVFTC